MFDRLLMKNDNNNGNGNNSQLKQNENNNVKLKDESQEDNNRRKEGLNLLPCDHYEYEYNNCSSWKAKVNNYFRGIEISDQECLKYQELFVDCHKYQKDPVNNFNLLLKLNTYENDLMKRRIDSARGNDIWEMRTSPPSDWNSKLPDWAQKRLENTLWYKSLQQPPPLPDKKD